MKPKKEYTEHEKLALYRAGHYVSTCPSVCTANWNVNDWISYIDACDGWKSPKGVKK